MMGTLHAKEDYSQYPISDSQNDHAQSDHGFSDINTQGETAIPAQLENHTETEQVSERVRSIIGGKNMFSVHSSSDDSTWQDATQKTAHWSELSEGGGHAGTLPTPPNTIAITTTQPHNINLQSSMLGASINSYSITEQLHSSNHQTKLLPKGCTDAIINGEFCYGKSSIMGAQLQGTQLHEAQPHEAQPPHSINLQSSMLGASINSYCITEQLHWGNQQTELLPKGCTDAIINGEFCYGKSSIMGARLQGTQLQGTQLQEAQLQGTQLQGTQLQEAQLQGTQLQEAQLQGTQPDSIGEYVLDIQSPKDVAEAYSSVLSESSSTLHQTLSKVMTSYVESTDAHGSIASNHHALELVRGIERSFHGKTITVSA